MSTILLHYSDGYADDDGEGIKEFGDVEAASRWIKNRLEQDKSRTLENYRVFRAEELEIKAIKRVVEIEIK